MSIISQETWDKFSKEEKEKLRKKYNDLKRDKDSNKPRTELNIWFAGRFVELEEIFGEENLQPKPKIRTWEDIEQKFEDSTYIETSDGMINEDYRITLSDDFDSKIIDKVITTLKISKLIELGYGGIVTTEEIEAYKETNNSYYTIVPNDNGELFIARRTSHFGGNFISFHIKQQAEEFMSYPENVQLVKAYYML